MIAQPTPQQYALVAQLLQRHTQQNPNVLQQGGSFYSQNPSPTATGDWDYGPMTHLPTVVTPGYGRPSGPTVMEDAQPGPFLQHAQALTAATRSNLQSHQQALIQRFMKNAQAQAARGVRK